MSRVTTSNSAIPVPTAFLRHLQVILREAAYSQELGYDFSDDSDNPADPAVLSKKRHGNLIQVGDFVERILALFILVVLSPLMLLVALIIKSSSKGPSFYAQVRRGKNGKSFKIFKFRTMIVDAEKDSGPVLSWKNDNRITAVGSLLRKTHLDELPQLINIINGDMSFIGPRPERPELIRKFIKNVENYDARESVKPGVTGLAQICCPYDASPADKLVYDMYYIRNKDSIFLSAMILWFTFLKVLKGVEFFDKKTLE